MHVPHEMTLAEIEQTIVNYAKAAQEGKIKLEDMQGGCFTITNGGTLTLPTAADMIICIPPNGNPRNNRDINNDKERFIIGVLRSADERLSRSLVPSLKDQLAWYITIRGWYAGRALLTKNGNNRTTVDITPLRATRFDESDHLRSTYGGNRG